MGDYIGQQVLVRTPRGTVNGRLVALNRETGKVMLEDAYNISNEIDLADVLDVRLEGAPDEGAAAKGPSGVLAEKDMYGLFYDAFNVYGPSEEQFVLTAALAVKKFLKDVASARVRIVVGTDDIFGRVGLCLARLLLDRVELLHVEMPCHCVELRTQQHMSAYANSGGVYAQQDDGAAYTLVVFACNRHFDFSRYTEPSGLTILLDVPSDAAFKSFTALGLGFTPEHYRACPRSFYMIDAGFGALLCDKYGIRKHYKNSLIKIDLPQ